MDALLLVISYNSFISYELINYSDIIDSRLLSIVGPNLIGPSIDVARAHLHLLRFRDFGPSIDTCTARCHAEGNYLLASNRINFPPIPISCPHSSYPAALPSSSLLPPLVSIGHR